MSKFFCKLPFTDVQVRYEDLTQPCCVHRGYYPLKDLRRNPDLRRVKQSLLNGIAPPECGRCVEDEQNSGTSFRVVEEIAHPEIIQDLLARNDPDYFDIETVHVWTSNICNLKCTMCDDSSFARVSEMHRLGLWPTIPILRKNDRLDNLLDKPFRRISLLGGEPFFDVVTFDFLQKLVDRGRSQDIMVDLNTNATGITQEKMDFLTDNFRQVMIKASIDGFGEVNEYLRYGSVWNDVERSIDIARSAPRTDVIITSAVSNIGMLRYHQLLEWGIGRGINMYFMPVEIPDAMNVRLWPAELKQRMLPVYQDLKQKYTGKIWDRTEHCIDTAIYICEHQDWDPEAWSRAIEWHKLHDRHRGNDIFQIFPELVDFS